MNGSCGRPAVEVAPVSLTPDGMVPSSTIWRISPFVSGVVVLRLRYLEFSHFRLAVLARTVRGIARQVVLFLSTWRGGRLNVTVLAVGGSIAASVLMLLICSRSGFGSSSTWLLSGVPYRLKCIIFFILSIIFRLDSKTFLTFISRWSDPGQSYSPYFLMYHWGRCALFFSSLKQASSS